MSLEVLIVQVTYIFEPFLNVRDLWFSTVTRIRAENPKTSGEETCKRKSPRTIQTMTYVHELVFTKHV